MKKDLQKNIREDIVSTDPNALEAEVADFNRLLHRLVGPAPRTQENRRSRDALTRNEGVARNDTHIQGDTNKR